ncbi:hypothetical protein N9Y42_09345 [Mariniblastus sp.]|nr:hypothetical protein [Mariniblastus sp.]
MNELLEQIRVAFATFERPAIVTICEPDGECIDCLWTDDDLRGKTSSVILDSDDLVFATLPLDCLNADAFLHYFPAIAQRSLVPSGIHAAEAVAWNLAREIHPDDPGLTPSMKPKLSMRQLSLFQSYLVALSGVGLSELYTEELGKTRRRWDC